MTLFDTLNPYVLFYSGIKKKEASAVELGKRILKLANNNLNELGKLSIKDLMKVKGFGKKKFEKLKANLTVSGPTTLAVKRVSAGGSELPAASLPAGAQEAQGRAPPARR